MQESARAKINLSLRVIGRRPDNYHELESLVVFAETHDTLAVSVADNLLLSISGPFAAALKAEDDNLVLRAARKLQDYTGISKGAHLHLEKNLPVASGIGGGSADAAAALRLLKSFWNVELAEKELTALALSLGADVPVCLQTCPVMMRGIGERLSPVSALPKFWMVLVNPGVGVSTADIFRKLGAAPVSRTQLDDTAPRFDNFESLCVWLQGNPNDLQEAAIELNPIIGNVLELLMATQNCRLARMSGSGATCFGLYEGEHEAAAAAKELRKTRDDWWISVSACG